MSHQNLTPRLALALVFATALGVIGSAAATQAATITVDNPSFESPVVGNFVQNPDQNTLKWTLTNGGATFITDGGFSGFGGDWPETSAGDQWLQLNKTADAFQNVGTIAADTLYTLTLTLGEHVSGFPDTFEYGLWADMDNELAPSEPDAPLAFGDDTNTTFDDVEDDTPSTEDVTVTFDSRTLPAGIDIGDHLFIQFRNTDSAGSSVLFDDVALDATLIPEPATFALLGLGGAVMLPGRKRRA